MKQVSNDYKNAIIDLGRQYDVKITYGNTTLTNEQLNQVTPHYRSDLLKSVMKQLDLDSNVEIPIGTEINCQFGLKVGNSYEYIDYGNYIVYSSEKQEDLLSYRIVCYDKMLYAMKDYEDLEITYPISIKNYISAIATKIGLQFEDDDFTNADKEIPEEKYLDEDGNTLGYTYRDVLDEIAQATASIICVANNNLKVIYPQDLITETGTFENTSGTITTDGSKVLDLELEGNTTQETTTGKNLFNLNATPDGGGNISSRVITDQKLTLTRMVGTTATSYYSYGINVEANTTYYVSGKAKITNIDLVGGSAVFVRQDKNGGTVLGSQDLNVSLTTEQNISFSFNSGSYTKVYLWFYVDSKPNETSSTGTRVNEYINIQLEKGSSATSYEKFTYGASPNPDYPQPIQVATGRQEVDVVGKNYFDGTKVSTTHTSNWGISFENNILTIQHKNTYTTGTPEINVGVLPSGTYVFSGTLGGSVGLYINDTYNKMLSSGTTFTCDGTQKISIKFTNNSATTLTYTNVMLETGSTATTYEPYISNKYEINLGKNLLGLPNGTYSNNGITAVVENGVITLNGTATSNSYINITPIANIVLNGGNYTYSLNNAATGTTEIRLFDTNNNYTSLWATSVNNKRTNSDSRTFNSVSIVTTSGNILNNLVIKPQLEKGSVATSFSPYFTPIELCKINDYKDSIKKSEGKNLLDTSELKDVLNENGASRKGFYFQIQKTGTYYVLFQKLNTQNILYCGKSTDLTQNTTALGKNSINHSFTYNFNEGEYFIIWGATNNDVNDEIMLTLSSEAIPYEPYGSGKWYIEKNIGKVVLDGNTTPTSVNNSSTNTTRFFASLDSNGLNNSPLLYCNRLIGTTSAYNQDVEGAYISTNLIVVRINKSLIGTTTSTIKTWLGSNNLIAYYPLATPTYTEITNTTLINELESIELLDGLNNISITSANLSSPLKISYISEYETITEDYLKDTNVNFSEKFGPVNSLVLSRSADSDLIYRKDDSSIERNGLTEIKISDNQILNGNDRDEYIDNIFNKLKGLEYYTNDYDSTGITYLDLGDFYKVEARGNRYLALMLNDELNVTQGFEELIHTDKPDTSVSDYKKADTTDRRINQATLIVDKQNQTIQALTSRTSNLESKQINDKAELLAKFGDYALDSRVDDITTQVETLQTDTYTKTEVKSILKGTFYDSDNNQIVSEVVKTTSGTFDENGMHYEKTNAKTKSTINEVGVRVDNAINDSELLFAGYDDNINQTIVRTDNLTVRNFLVVGSQSRFQDYEENNEQGTGVFDL